MKETLQRLKTELYPIYGKQESDAIIRLIFHYLKGWNLTDLLIHAQDPLSPFIKSEIEKILERLKSHEPIQYITGEARFHGMDLAIRPGVLIPRPETDQLVDIIIDENRDREDLRVLDICTGSGCIAIALARNLPFSKVYALDFSEEAIETASENAEKLHAKIKIIKGDIFDWEPSSQFDIIVSNPPYVMDSEALKMEKNVLDYEPHEALFVRDEDALVFYRRICDLGIKYLEKGGRLYFEINPLKASALKQLVISQGYDDVEIRLDSYGKQRFLIARKPRK